VINHIQSNNRSLVFDRGYHIDLLHLLVCITPISWYNLVSMSKVGKPIHVISHDFEGKQCTRMRLDAKDSSTPISWYNLASMSKVGKPINVFHTILKGKQCTRMRHDAIDSSSGGYNFEVTS